MDNNVGNFSVSEEGSVLDAMKIIGTAEGACFVVDRLGRLVGAISDGDIRRHLLEGGHMSDALSAVMQGRPVSIHHLAKPSEIQEKLTKVRFLALVDDSQKLVGIASRDQVRRYPLAAPSLNGNELAYVTDAVMSGWISSQGRYVLNFESQFSTFVGSANALAVSNGTVAIELALATLGIGQGDEVIVPAYTFAATANAVIARGASVVFVDVEEETIGLDPKLISGRVTARTKAIIVPHLYGCPARIDEIMGIAKSQKLYVIEDCAEAFGTSVRGRHVGLFGHAATFSFFGNKTISTGEGGMVIFSNQADADRARILRDHGTTGKVRYSHEYFGFNFRLTNLQAAIGVAQLERAEKIVREKKRIGEAYIALLDGVGGLTLPKVGSDFVNSFWLFTLLLDPTVTGSPEHLVEELSLRGIEARRGFRTLPFMPSFRSHPDSLRSFPIAESISNSALSLPTSVGMTEDDVGDVVSIFLALID